MGYFGSRRNRQAMALIFVLMFSTIFLSMIAGIIWKARSDGWLSQHNRADAIAEAAAESGIAYAISKLSKDPSWGKDPGLGQDVIDHELPGSEAKARFSIVWGSTASINNLANSNPADGPRGENTVPSHSAYLVVTGKCDLKTCTLEVIVGPNGPNQVYPALITTGTVSFLGSVSVTGLRSLSGTEKVQADIVSTLKSDSANLIDWNETGELSIEGSIVSNGNNANAISSSFEGKVSGSIQNNQANSISTPIDIVATVNGKSSASRPNLSGSQTLTAGDYYFPSGIGIAGDLTLEGANLYVAGDVKLNGSIRGKGSVYVTGSTTFKGDASITTGEDQQIALYSKGDVELTGFNGTQALEDWSLNGGLDEDSKLSYSEHFENFQKYLKNMNKVFNQAKEEFENGQEISLSELFNTGPIDRFKNAKIFGNGTLGLGFTSEFDYYLDILSHNTGPNYKGIALEEKYTNPLKALKHLVAKQPAGETKDFLKSRLKELYSESSENPSGKSSGLFRYHSSPNDALGSLQNALESGSTDGLFDAVNDLWSIGDTGGREIQEFMTSNRSRLLGKVKDTLTSIDFARIGSGSFRGTIYTEGNFTAENDLVIEGSLIGAGPQSDITLNNLTLVYTPEFSQQSGGNTGMLGVRTWVRR